MFTKYKEHLAIKITDPPTQLSPLYVSNYKMVQSFQVPNMKQEVRVVLRTHTKHLDI